MEEANDPYRIPGKITNITAVTMLAESVYKNKKVTETILLGVDEYNNVYRFIGGEWNHIVENVNRGLSDDRLYGLN